MVNQVCESGFTSLNFALVKAELSIIILKSTESTSELGKNFRKSTLKAGEKNLTLTHPSTK